MLRGDLPNFCHPEGTKGSYQTGDGNQIRQKKILTKYTSCHFVQNDNFLSSVIARGVGNVARPVPSSRA